MLVHASIDSLHQINVAQGRKLAAVLASEAAMQEAINKGDGEASAIAAKVRGPIHCLGHLQTTGLAPSLFLIPNPDPSPKPYTESFP